MEEPALLFCTSSFWASSQNPCGSLPDCAFLGNMLPAPSSELNLSDTDTCCHTACCRISKEVVNAMADSFPRSSVYFLPSGSSPQCSLFHFGYRVLFPCGRYKLRTSQRYRQRRVNLFSRLRGVTVEKDSGEVKTESQRQIPQETCWNVLLGAKVGELAGVMINTTRRK